MIRHLGSSLTDVTYVFDEPTIGLHPHDIERMNGLLLQLRDKGNTVLVVEHKPEVIDDRGPRDRSRSRRGNRRRPDRVRGHGRGAARQQHAHRAPSRRPGVVKASVRRCIGSARGPRREAAQPSRRRRRHPPRDALRDHGRRRLRQELADPRLGRRPRRRRGRSTRERSMARDEATRRPTRGCSTRSARRSRRRTA